MTKILYCLWFHKRKQGAVISIVMIAPQYIGNILPNAFVLPNNSDVPAVKIFVQLFQIVNNFCP